MGNGSRIGCPLGALAVLLASFGGLLVKACGSFMDESSKIGKNMPVGTALKTGDEIVAGLAGGLGEQKFISDLVRISRDDVLNEILSKLRLDDSLKSAPPSAHQELMAMELGDPWRAFSGEDIRQSRLADVESIRIPTTVVSPKLIAVTPASEADYVKVFDESPRGSHMSELSKLNRLIDESDSALRIAGTEGGGKKALLDMIEAHRDRRPIVILGHSENQGRILVLPDGDTLDVGTIHKECISRETRCVVLTCNSSDFEIKGNIASLDAYRMWTDALDAYRSAGADAVVHEDDFIYTMRESRVRRKVTRKRLFVSAVTVGAVTGTVYVIETLHSRTTETSDEEGTRG